jgi:hypothetical protein
MAKPRKKWATQPPLMSIARRSHPSEAAAYRNVRAWAAEYRAGGLNPRIQAIEVLVDEQDGHGWQLYETVNLADLPNDEQEPNP